MIAWIRLLKPATEPSSSAEIEGSAGLPSISGRASKRGRFSIGCMKLRLRDVLATCLGLATACSVVYDVDSITDNQGECGNENAECCSGDQCNEPLKCDVATNQCVRCTSADGTACCFAKNLSECVSEGSVANLGGVCRDGVCEARCDGNLPCSSLANARCCKLGFLGCSPCEGGSCVCKLCCAQCEGDVSKSIPVDPGQDCQNAAEVFCKSTAPPNAWSATSC
jgi:hypothetical protein